MLLFKCCGFWWYALCRFCFWVWVFVWVGLFWLLGWWLCVVLGGFVWFSFDICFSLLVIGVGWIACVVVFILWMVDWLLGCALVVWFGFGDCMVGVAYLLLLSWVCCLIYSSWMLVGWDLTRWLVSY